MDTNKITTVKVKKDTKSSLDKLKIIERESYDEVIQRLIRYFPKEQLELNSKTRKVIPERIPSVKEEKVKSFKNFLGARIDNKKEMPLKKDKKEDKKEEKISSNFSYP